MINKADAADPLVLARLRQREPHSVVVSAKTGEGIAEALAAVEADLPRPAVEVAALLPYDRGDLLSRVHDNGEVISARAHRRRHPAQGPGQRGPGRRARGVPRLTQPAPRRVARLDQ